MAIQAVIVDLFNLALILPWKICNINYLFKLGITFYSYVPLYFPQKSKLKSIRWSTCVGWNNKLCAGSYWFLLSLSRWHKQLQSLLNGHQYDRALVPLPSSFWSAMGFWWWYGPCVQFVLWSSCSPLLMLTDTEVQFWCRFSDATMVGFRARILAPYSAFIFDLCLMSYATPNFFFWTNFSNNNTLIKS